MNTRKPPLPRCHKSLVSDGRRRLLTALGFGTAAVAVEQWLPKRWSTPLVEAVVLPAHAQTSNPPPTGFLCTTTSFTLNPGDPANAQTLVPPPPVCNPGDGVNAIVRFTCNVGSASVQVPSPAGSNWSPNPAVNQTLLPGQNTAVNTVLTHTTGDQFQISFTASVSPAGECTIDPITVFGPL